MPIPYAETVYLLCSITSAITAILLWINFRKTGYRLLFWSALCFAGLTLNNVMVFIDFIVFPAADLGIIRTLPAVVSFGLLLYAFIWETV